MNVNYKEILDEKFKELSEVFTKVKNDASIEPEQKCEIIRTMLKIYFALKSN